MSALILPTGLLLGRVLYTASLRLVGTWWPGKGDKPGDDDE